MSIRPLAMKSIPERVETIERALSEFLSQSNNSGLGRCWPEWNRRLRDVHDESQKPADVAVSVIGGTGAGKSTLLNALVGARLLPVGNLDACTSAVCEIGHSDNVYYSAEVEFISRESWRHEVELLIGDLAAVEGDGEAAAPENQVERSARKKLSVVYKLGDNHAPIDVRNLEEPPDISQALDAGVVRFSAPELVDFRKQVALYLDSKHHFWPIVKSVSIRGPFPALASGAKLVDLPGLDDPNEAREEVTKNHLKTCRFVWVVFNLKRLLTKHVIDLLNSDVFLRQIVMDGRADALTLVSTASDDMDFDSAREEFGMDESATDAEVVLARNRKAHESLSRQLNELSHRIIYLAGGDREKSQAVGEVFRQTETFTVSAKEYLRLRGLSQARTAILEDLEQTEVPALCRHMDQICMRDGVQAQADLHHQQLDLLLKEVDREIRSQRVSLEGQAEATHRQKKLIAEVLLQAKKLLHVKLQYANKSYCQSLEASESLFGEKLRGAVAAGKRELQNVVSRWYGLAWQTLRAIVRRQGTYVGSIGKQDFPADVANPILDAITSSWTEFFEEKLGAGLDKGTTELKELAEEFSKTMLDSVNEIMETSDETGANLRKIFQTTGEVIAEQMRQTKLKMRQRIDQRRRTLYEKIPEHIRGNLQPAFGEAALISGPGQKNRIVDLLANRARSISEVMYQDSEQAIYQGVGELGHWLRQEFQQMIETVDRHTETASGNLLTDSTSRSTISIEEQNAVLQRGEDLVAGLLNGENE